MRGGLDFPEGEHCVHTRVCAYGRACSSREALQRNCFLQSMPRCVIKLRAGGCQHRNDAVCTR